MDNLRHGWGSSYDRNGNKLYEGDWRCGMNDYEKDCLVVEDYCENEFLSCDNIYRLVVVLAAIYRLRVFLAAKIFYRQKTKYHREKTTF